MPGIPGIPAIGPMTWAILSWLVSRTFLAAALTAAVTRSSSMPMSPGSTTDLSIFTRTTSNWPLTVAVTRPPPAAPSHSIFASSSCACARSPWSFCACFIRSPRSGVLGLDFGLVLLELRAEGLEHVLVDRVLARLDLALGSRGRAGLAAGLDDRARAGLPGLRRVERPHRDLHRLHLRNLLADDPP